MDRSIFKINFFLYGIRRILKRIWRWILIITAAFFIGFSNAYYNEFRTLADYSNKLQQEQVFDDEDTNQEKQHPLYTDCLNNKKP